MGGQVAGPGDAACQVGGQCEAGALRRGVSFRERSSRIARTTADLLWDLFRAAAANRAAMASGSFKHNVFIAMLLTGNAFRQRNISIA